MRTVCIPIATRGNHAKTTSVVAAMDARDDLRAVTVLTGGIALPRFGDHGAVMAAQGRPADRTVHYLVEGETPIAMAKSAGLATIELAACFAETKPDIVFVIADRYEALSFAQAAVCLNIPIAHLEGGEISGSIDERLRHAITKLAHIHLVASAEAAGRLHRMGEAPETVHVVGTPSFDLVAAMDLDDTGPLAAALQARGHGATVDPARPFVLVSLMPDIIDLTGGQALVEETGQAVLELGLPAVWLAPNMDAGADVIGGALRDFRERHPAAPIRFVPSLPFEAYARALARAACFLGNSSSGIREGAFLGTPVVNIGTRQTDRRRGRNVLDCGHDRAAIVAAARRQMGHGRYPSDPLYGDGTAGARIAQILATAPLGLDKRMTY